jgi:hypothetical protein
MSGMSDTNSARPLDSTISQSDPSQSHASDRDRDNDKPISTSELKNPLIWHDPGRISSLNLFDGQGTSGGQPVGPFTFESEDLNGSNPKFDARDANDRKWRVKLGNEARPEVVASRLLWAVGYFVNEDYVLPEANVDGLHLQRGASLARDGHIKNARFARKPQGQKKIGIWKWKQNPFTGTREFNGLRVMMAVMNNWDLKDVNNAVYSDKSTHKDLLLVSDIGATFGTNGLSWTKGRSKGDSRSFENSRFITHATDSTVDFATPRPPTATLVETAGLDAKDYIAHEELEWIGANIPRADARWIASLLSQLSHQQLVDAFRAGNFSPEEIQTYVEIVEARIHELSSL